MDISVRIANLWNVIIASNYPSIGTPMKKAESSVMIAKIRTSHSTAVNRGSRAAGFFPFPAARVHGAGPREGSGFFNACVIHIDQALYT